MKPIEIEKVKVGQFFHLKDDPDAPIWIRSTYVRELKKFEAYKYDDINHLYYLKKGRIVYTEEK